MKNNTFKRVLAGSLALLTVAAPMSANVEGVLQEVAIVASAAKGDDITIAFTDVQKYITSVTVGSNTVTASTIENVPSYKFAGAAGETATIVSTVPFANTTFGKNNTAYAGYVDTGVTEAYYTQMKADNSLNATINETTYTSLDAKLKPFYTQKDGAYALLDFSAVKNTASAWKQLIEYWRTDTAASSNFVNVTALVKADATYQLQDGDFTIEEKNGTYTTKVVIPSNWNGPFSLAGDKASLDATFTASTENINLIEGDMTVGKKATDSNLKTDKPDQIINSTVTLSSAYNFSIAVSETGSASTDVQNVAAKYDTTEKRYIAEFKMPAGGANIVVTGEKAEALTYSVSTDKTQMLVNGATVTADTVAAQFTATQQRDEVRDPVTDAVTEEAIKADTEYKTGGSYNYLGAASNKVTVKLFADGNLLTQDQNQGAYAKVTVTKDGTVYTMASAVKTSQKFEDVIYNTKPADLKTAIDTFTFHDAGTYVITATMYYKAANGGVDSKDISFTVKINPIKVSESDVTLQFGETANDVADGNSSKKYDLNITPKPVKFAANKVMEIEVPNDVAGKKTYYADIELPASFGLTKNPTTIPANNKYYTVDGDLTATALDEIKKVTVKIYDPNYGATATAAKTMTLQYKLVKAAQQPEVTIVDDAAEAKATAGRNPVNAYTLTVPESKTDAATFEEIFWNNFQGNDTVEKGKEKISFEYVVGSGKSWQADELDSREAGFPTKTNDLNYTLYVLYDGEAFFSVDVVVTDKVAYVVPAASELQKTYGEKFEVNKYTLVDGNGKEIKDLTIDEVLIKSIKLAADKDGDTVAGKKNGVQAYKNDKGRYVTTGNEITDTILDAGTYIVEFTANVSKDTGYYVDSEEYVLVVDRRTITADMFTAAPKIYTGKQFNETIDDITFKYTKEDKSVIAYDTNQDTVFTITDGQVKATDIGSYNVNIKVIDKEDYTARTGLNKNFTGTAKVAWSVVPNERTYSASVSNTVPTTSNVKLTWDAAESTLYDEGRIHVKYKRPADGNVKAYDANKKAVTIADYGVIFDKNGVIPAPTYNKSGSQTDLDVYKNAKNGDQDIANNKYYDNASFSKALKLLKYGNNFGTGHASEQNKKDNVYGANIKVKDVETGIWVRPYALYSDGSVSYGNPIYLDITNEAVDQLQVKFNPTKKNDKTNTNAGYQADINKFYAYATYEKIDATKVKAKVQDFGVVVDKKGAFGIDGVSTSDKKLNVDKGLRIGKGFIEGHNNKAPDAVLAAEEYGAKISPKDTVTGVWVRPYVNLGGGLVVYGTPEYYQSVSDYYACTTRNDSTVSVEGNVVGQILKAHNVGVAASAKATPAIVGLDSMYNPATGKYAIKFTNTVPKNDPNYDFVKMGVILDKSESLLSKTLNTGNKDYHYAKKDPTGTVTATKMQLGNGFVEGKKTVANNEYTANVTPESEKAITVVPYVTFKVNDTVGEITVYGNPVIGSKNVTNSDVNRVNP